MNATDLNDVTVMISQWSTEVDNYVSIERRNYRAHTIECLEPSKLAKVLLWKYVDERNARGQNDALQPTPFEPDDFSISVVVPGGKWGSA